MLRNRVGFLPGSGIWMCMWTFGLLSAPPPPPPLVYEAEDDDVKRQSDFKILTRSVVFSIGELNFWVSPSSQFETGIFCFFGFLGGLRWHSQKQHKIWRKRSRGIMGWPDLCWFCRWWCVYGRGMERRTSKFIRHPFGSIRMVNSRLSRYHYIR